MSYKHHKKELDKLNFKTREDFDLEFVFQIYNEQGLQLPDWDGIDGYCENAQKLSYVLD